MRKFLLVCGVVLCTFAAQPSQLASLIVLSVPALGSRQLPAGWQIKVNHGKPDISVCSDSDGSCIHLKSVRSSFALERGMDVDPAHMPFLAWKWKIAELPPRGDFRRASTDDQAAQVLVAFADRHVLSYIWDSTAPKGTVQNASSIPFVHIYAVVCESGAAEANRWINEVHNVAADYERVYGRPAPHVKGLRIQINSQHTGATAESYFGEVAFRSTSQ